MLLTLTQVSFAFTSSSILIP